MKNENEDSIYEQEIRKLRQKYANKGNLIMNLVNFDKQKIKECFPQDQKEVSKEEMMIINQDYVLSLRFIYLSYKIYRNKQHWTQKSIIFSQQNESYRFLGQLQPGYRQRYIQQKGLILEQNKILQNYSFYNSEHVKRLHQKKGDYSWLQSRHDYIQYMFPNHYQSMFNMRAYPMDYYEVQLFKQSQEIGLRLLQSINIFFDFMGIKLDENQQIVIISQKRLNDVLLVNWHNHLRLRRILACLSVTGFRHIALKLVEFLKQLIIDNKKYDRISRDLESWTAYGDDDFKKALKLCFHPGQSFPPKHIIYASKVYEQKKTRNQQQSSQQHKETQKIMSKNTKMLQQPIQSQQKLSKNEELKNQPSQENKIAQKVNDEDQKMQQQEPINKSQEIINNGNENENDVKQ